MEIVRRIFGNIDSNTKRLLVEKALSVKFGNGYFNHDINENSVEYDRIRPLIRQLDLQDNIIGTRFTNHEIKKSEVLVFKGNYVWSYPQPEDDPKEILKNVYINSCPVCGGHDEQRAPFQIKEPRIANHAMFLLNWINDELFAKCELYDSLFKKIGMNKREVLLYKKNRHVESVIQLDIPQATFDWELGNLESSKCVACNRTRYSPIEIGFYPKPELSGADFVKSREFFGSGFASSNKMLVSNAIMNELISLKIAKIHQFTPTR